VHTTFRRLEQALKWPVRVLGDADVGFGWIGSVPRTAKQSKTRMAPTSVSVAPVPLQSLVLVGACGERGLEVSSVYQPHACKTRFDAHMCPSKTLEIMGREGRQPHA
jgi:hypothetical protein